MNENIEAILHRQTMLYLESIYRAYGIRVEAITADWQNISTMDKSAHRVESVQLITRTEPKGESC